VKSDAASKARLARRELSRLWRTMEDVAEGGAEELRATDPYTDRTGDLRKNTAAIVAQAGAEIVVSLEMGMHYASYVNALGYSNFDQVTDQTKMAMRHAIAALKRRITQ
jgi:hypothetical protein